MESPNIRINRHSSEWRQIRAYIEARLIEHRKALESSLVPVERVPSLRARIDELNLLLKANPEEQDHE
jgi:hypothetical protein